MFNFNLIKRNELLLSVSRFSKCIPVHQLINDSDMLIKCHHDIYTDHTLYTQTKPTLLGKGIQSLPEWVEYGFAVGPAAQYRIVLDRRQVWSLFERSVEAGNRNH